MRREVLELQKEVMEVLMKAQELQREMQEVQEFFTEVLDPLHAFTSCPCSAGLQQRAEPLEELSSTHCPSPNACQPCTALQRRSRPPLPHFPRPGRAAVLQGWCKDAGMQQEWGAGIPNPLPPAQPLSGHCGFGGAAHCHEMLWQGWLCQDWGHLLWPLGSGGSGRGVGWGWPCRGSGRTRAREACARCRVRQSRGRAVLQGLGERLQIPQMQQRICARHSQRQPRAHGQSRARGDPAEWG